MNGEEWRKTSFLALFIISFLLVPVNSLAQEERIIVNSADWTDVYSGVLYANLKGIPNYFLTSPRHATLIPYSIPKSVDRIEIITSRTNPFASGYKALLEIEGYKQVDEIRTSNINLDLLDELPEITKFIIIDDSYGYNSISVAPYAVLANYYVLFADRGTIGQVTNVLEDRQVDDIIIYGQVDRQVKSALEEYNPEIINTGDRFDNNIEIVKKFQDTYSKLKGEPRKQAILNNGEFIESSLMAGNDPVLFIGFSNVPEQVREYIADSPLEVGTLVGNELIGTATFIRRQTGLSVFVKFGQGSRTPQTSIAQVEDLDRFPIPRFGLNLDIVAVSLNTATNNLEITYQNKAQIGTYFTSLAILLRDDDSSFTVPDEGSTDFVDANDFKTIIYDLMDEDGNQIELTGENLNAHITTIYGESPKSLEQTLIANVSVTRISVFDSAEIEIIDVAFRKTGSKFLIKVKNIGEVDAYATAELIDLFINGELVTISADDVIKLKSGQTKTLVVTTEMTEEDIPENPEVKVRVIYGERENALTKQKQATFAFKFATPNLYPYIILVLIVILLLLIFLRKKCKNCKHKNPIGRKQCKKCGHRL